MQITQSSNLNNIIDCLWHMYRYKFRRVASNIRGVHNRFRQFNIKSDSDANYT